MNLDPQQILTELFEADGEKFFDEPADEPMFEPPRVAIADASDPWFDRFKTTLGEFYWTPQQALATEFPTATARSVICWSLPVAKIARKANRSADKLPARLWAYVRAFGEPLNTRLRDGLVARLSELGFAAVAPAVSPQQATKDRSGVGIASNWSERHTAFVAGMGTFGITGNLITSHGAAHRLGSVVTDLELPATVRPYGDDPFAWCLKTAKGTCGACIDRCPAGSVGETPADRDKKTCSRHAHEVISKRGEAVFGFKGVYGCGLCQTGVPCESRNPVG